MRLISRSSLGIDTEHVFLVDGEDAEGGCASELWCDGTHPIRLAGQSFGECSLEQSI